MNNNSKCNYKISSLLKFIIPSLIGIMLFMIPSKIGGQITIPIAFLSSYVVNVFNDILPLLVTCLISISAIGSIFIKIFKTDNKILNSLFNVTPIWMTGRIIGMILSIMTLFKIGPEFIWSDATGGMGLFSLLPTLVSVFLFAGLFLP